MKFLVLTLLIGALFFLDVQLNLIEKVFFIGIYLLCLAMEIGSIIIEIKYPSNDERSKRNLILRLWNKIKK